LIPYSATFLVFSDYMRPAMRLAALSDLAPIFVLRMTASAWAKMARLTNPLSR